VTPDCARTAKAGTGAWWMRSWHSRPRRSRRRRLADGRFAVIARSIISLGIVFLALTVPCRAQGTVYGCVREYPLPASGATVRAESATVSRHTKADLLGCYEFSDLPAGTYTVTATASPETVYRCYPAIRTNVIVRVSGRERVDLNLERDSRQQRKSSFATGTIAWLGFSSPALLGVGVIFILFARRALQGRPVPKFWPALLVTPLALAWACMSPGLWYGNAFDPPFWALSGPSVAVAAYALRRSAVGPGPGIEGRSAQVSPS
jgi:hypothetical protein